MLSAGIACCADPTPAAGAPRGPTSLWDEFWSYDICQYKTTQVRFYREDLTRLAEKTGPAPASDAAVIRKHYAGGTVRALFLIPYAETRYPLELAARFDLDYDVLPVSLFSAKARAGDGFKALREDLNDRLLAAIESNNFDVIVALGFDGSVLSAEEQARVCGWIRGGLGWVDLGVGRERPDAESAIRALSPLTGRPPGRNAETKLRPGDAHFIRSGLPPGAELKGLIPDRLTGRPILRAGAAVVVAARGEGAGRVVSYAGGWPWDEAGYSLLMKCVLWAGRKETSILADTPPHGAFRRRDCVELSSGSSAPGADSKAGFPLQVLMASAGGAGPTRALKLRWELRDETDTACDAGALEFQAAEKEPAVLYMQPAGCPPAGALTLYYAVEDEAGRLAAWGQDDVLIESDLALAGIELPDFFERTAPSLTGTFRFDNARETEADVAYSVRLLDSHGRRLPFERRQKARIKPGGATDVEFRIPCDFEYLFGPMGLLLVEASEKGEAAPFARRKVPFYAPRVPAAALDDWHCGVCGIGPGLNEPNAHPWAGVYPAMARALRERGINAANNGVWRYPNDLIPLAREGFPIFTEYLCTMFGHFSTAYENHEFAPGNYAPPWTEKGREQMARQVERVKQLRQLGVVHYACSQEIGLGPSEVCLAEATQEAFRKWVLGRYGDVQRVNVAWDTAFAADDIRGVLLEEAAAQRPDNPAQWMDFRLFMEDLFNGALEEYCRLGKSHAPEGFFGYDAGPYEEIPTAAHNRARLGQTIDSCVEYLGPWLNMGSIGSYFDILRSRQVPMLCSVAGYSTVYQPTPWVYQNAAWYTALHGGKGVVYYAAIHPSLWAKLDGTGAPNGATDLIHEVNDDLLNGLGRLIIGSKRAHTGVGIYYSRPSLYRHVWRMAVLSRADRRAREESARKEAEALRDNPGGAAESGKPAGTESGEAAALRTYSSHSLAALRELVMASGYNYDRVFKDQLLSGHVAREYKVLLLPAVSCLSEAELAALQNFVRGGGLLVADLETGLYDERGRPNPKRAEVEALFGIKRDLDVFALEPVKGVMAGADGGDFEGYGAGGVRARGAQALASLAGQDALLEHGEGKGKTLYLNCVPKRHGNWSNVARDPLFVSPALRREFIRLAESVGAPRPLVLADGAGEVPGLDNVEIVRYDRGRSRYVFFHHKFESNDVAAVRARLDRPLHVYDMRRREYLGLTDAPALAVPPPSQAAAYAFLDHRVLAVKVAAPKRARAGEPIPVRLSLETEGGRPDAHGVHLEVRGPDGKRQWRFTRNVDVAGNKAEIVLRPTLDEQPGRWTLKARDVPSGVSGEASVDLLAP